MFFLEARLLGAAGTIVRAQIHAGDQWSKVVKGSLANTSGVCNRLELLLYKIKELWRLAAEFCRRVCPCRSPLGASQKLYLARISEIKPKPPMAPALRALFAAG